MNKSYWIKYEEQPNNWCNKDASYNKLYNDLRNSKTGWNIAESKSECETQLCGEMIAYDGTPSGEIHVYYKEDENNNKIPLMYIKIRESVSRKDEIIAEVFGTEMILEDKDENRYYNFEVEPELLPILISKLKEEGINKQQITEYETKYNSYMKLVELQKNGIKTGEDILFLYSNFNREDTIIPRLLMRNRSVQNDYNNLSFEEKCEFVNIICNMNSNIFYSRLDPLSRLKKLTNSKDEDKLFEIDDKEVLLSTATSTQLSCLDYAKEDLLNDRDTLLDILDCFEIKYSISFIKKIPTKFRTDIEIIQTLIKTKPSRIRDVLDIFIREDDGTFKEKIRDKDFATNLVDAYFIAVLKNEQYVKEQYAYYDFLWSFPNEVLDDIENKILVGPQPTEECEKLKNKIYTKTRKTCNEIRNYRKAN